MTQLRDCTEPATWWPHLDEAVRALAAGGLVVMPTDTVYGIAADAFSAAAVQALLDAKGRGRQMPPPVLIGDVRTLDGLADAVPDRVRELVAEHWPGPLTVIVQAQPSLQWDLGETRGTVALRMPDHELTLAVLRKTGPLAVSSANRSGSPAAVTAADAAEQLGDAVRVYLDGGQAPGGVASTIVDATGPELRIVREGALTAEQLGIAPPVPDEPEQGPEPATDEDAARAGSAPSGGRRRPRRATAKAGPPRGAGTDAVAATTTGVDEADVVPPGGAAGPDQSRADGVPEPGATSSDDVTEAKLAPDADAVTTAEVPAADATTPTTTGTAATTPSSTTARRRTRRRATASAGAPAPRTAAPAADGADLPETAPSAAAPAAADDTAPGAPAP